MCTLSSPPPTPNNHPSLPQVETRATGVEREAAEGRATEHMGAQERVVSEAAPRSPCD